MKITVLRPDAVPAGLPAFRVPESSRVQGRPLERLGVARPARLLGERLEARLVWAGDRSLTRHPSPWGF
jgi:hypothetical protein